MFETVTVELMNRLLSASEAQIKDAGIGGEADGVSVFTYVSMSDGSYYYLEYNYGVLKMISYYWDENADVYWEENGYWKEDYLFRNKLSGETFYATLQ